MALYRSLRRIFAEPEPGPVVRRVSRTSGEEELRRDAETILHAAVDGVEPEGRVVAALRRRLDKLPGSGRIRIAGFGSAAAPMARGAQQMLGERIAGGTLIVPPGHASYSGPAELDTFVGGHPIPDQGGEAGARAIRQLAREAQKDDLLLCLVSGSGSSLLTLPPDGLPLVEVQEVIRLLLEAGAGVADLSCVAKHLDALKAGRLAREAAPARVLSLVLSDLAGDPLDLIASGPVSPDPTTFADAIDVLQRYGVWKQVPLAARGYLDRGVCEEIDDSPKAGDPCFERVETEIVGGGDAAARSACAAAQKLGYDSQLLTSTPTGEAREAGGFLATTARVLAGSRQPDAAPTCLVTAGRLKARNDDPPNQELVLGALSALDGLDSLLIASMASAGIDGETEAAGAVASSSSLSRLRAAGKNGSEMLEPGRGAALFTELDDRIVSGPTGTDVGDIQILLLT
jgi:hydroxypyruvate reductase